MGTSCLILLTFSLCYGIGWVYNISGYNAVNGPYWDGGSRLVEHYGNFSLDDCATQCDMDGACKSALYRPGWACVLFGGICRQDSSNQDSNCTIWGQNASYYEPRIFPNYGAAHCCARWNSLASDGNTRSQSDVNAKWRSGSPPPDASNYCAQPENDPGTGPWCYFANKGDASWDYCTTPISPDLVFQSAAAPSVCIYGCAHWANLISDNNTRSQSDVNAKWICSAPSNASNYCAQPAHDPGTGPWCYCAQTGDASWGYCT